MSWEWLYLPQGHHHMVLGHFGCIRVTTNHCIVFDWTKTFNVRPTLHTMRTPCMWFLGVSSSPTTVAGTSAGTVSICCACANQQHFRIHIRYQCQASSVGRKERPRIRLTQGDQSWPHQAYSTTVVVTWPLKYTWAATGSMLAAYTRHVAETNCDRQVASKQPFLPKVTNQNIHIIWDIMVLVILLTDLCRESTNSRSNENPFTFSSSIRCMLVW